MLHLDYLSIKDNGDIIEITKLYDSVEEAKIGEVNKDGKVSFPGASEQYFECKNKDGVTFKDFYKL